MLNLLFKTEKKIKIKRDVDWWFKLLTYNTKEMTSILHVAFEISFLKACALMAMSLRS